MHGGCFERYVGMFGEQRAACCRGMCLPANKNTCVLNMLLLPLFCLTSAASGHKLPPEEAAVAQPLLASTCSHLASMAAAGYRTLVVAGA